MKRIIWSIVATGLALSWPSAGMAQEDGKAALQQPVILSADFSTAEAKSYADGQPIGTGPGSSQIIPRVGDARCTVKVTEGDSGRAMEFASDGQSRETYGVLKLVPQDAVEVSGSVVFSVLPCPPGATRGVFIIHLTSSAGYLTTGAASLGAIILSEGFIAKNKLLPGKKYRINMTADLTSTTQHTWRYTLGEEGVPEPKFDSGPLNTRNALGAPAMFALTAAGTPLVRVYKVELSGRRDRALAAAARRTDAAARATPPDTRTAEQIADDDTVICNHATPKNKQHAAQQETPLTPRPEIRCNNTITDSGILLFARGTQPLISLPIRSDRAADIAAQYTLDLMDRDGTLLGQQAGAIVLPAQATTNVNYTIDTREMKYGVYSLILHVASGDNHIADREYYLGVITDTKIPKSPDGAFLYGLDPNYGGVVYKAPAPPEPPHLLWTQGQCNLLPWMDAMGVDILRCAGCAFHFGDLFHPERLAWVTNNLPVLHQQGLRVTGMVGGADVNPADQAVFAKNEKKWTDLVEDVAHKTPEITYWELGNEPDLLYGDHGLPIDGYLPFFEKTGQAIKRGNPKAMVMNGGLSWAHGDVGLKNSRRFIELVKPETIDVIAFHAHGPGAEHETRVYELAHNAAAAFGKADKALADTESGMFVASKLQEDMQAWMVVKKQVIAQSVGLKFLMTFRLHAFRSERGWGLLRSDQEPQPAIVAYRNMTEHLKGLAFQKKLELSQAYAQGYVFAQSNGPQRACVVWADQPACYNVYLKLAPSAAQAKNLRQMDVYGNAAPADVSEDGVAHVSVTQWPVYLLWDAADPQAQVAVTRSNLRTPDMATLVPDGTSSLDLAVENPSGAALTATLSAAITAPGHATITPETQTITVPAHASAPAQLSVAWNAQQQDTRWPASWTVYSDVAEGDVDLAALHQLPATIKNVAGRQVQPVNHAISLLRKGEPPANRRAGFVFGTVHSDRDQVVRVGCTADWWLELRLNGQIVCDTMKTGNGSVTLTERIVYLPLKAGDNLLAAKVLSGQSGWHLDLALPDELPALIDPRKGNNCIDVTLRSAGRVMARERLAIRPVKRVAPLDRMKWDDPVEKWQAIPGDFVLGSAHVSNLYEKMPDNSKWWQGEKDLSATAWMRCDDQRVYLLVWVLDDKDVTGNEPEKMGEFDSLEIGVCREGRTPDLYTIGRVDGRVAVYREASSDRTPKGLLPAGSRAIHADVQRSGGGTLYRVAFDRNMVGDKVVGLNFLVNDNDAGYRKQFIESTTGLGFDVNPSLWQQFVLTAPTQPSRVPSAH